MVNFMNRKKVTVSALKREGSQQNEAGKDIQDTPVKSAL